MSVLRALGCQLVLWAVFVAAIPAWGATCTGPRLALAIGNRSYPDSDQPLREPIGNARLIAQTLRGLGYTVETGEDLRKSEMQAALDTFTARVEPGAVVFLFFSGIGLQSGGHTYLLPVDAVIWSEPDVRANGFNLDRIIGALDAKGAKVRIAVIDGGRRNPFERRFRTSGSLGLAPINGANETLGLFSSVPGAVFDESGLDTSPFATALAEALKAPNVMAEEAFRRTRTAVSRIAGAQQPWVSSSLSEDVALDARGCHDDLATRDKDPVPAGAPAAKAAASMPTAIPPVPPASQVAPSRPTLRPDESAKTSEAILVDRDQVDEVRERLYEQNLDPGAADSPEMDAALRAFQKKTGLPETGVPTRGVLRHLREAEPLKPWGAIVFSTAANRWGMSWGRPLRRQALDEATSRCGSDRCTRRMSFFGTRCGAFALSSRSWSITWRNGGERARQAALEECAKGGSACRLVGAVCADGSERAN